jgi:hypothetical protein
VSFVSSVVPPALRPAEGAQDLEEPKGTTKPADRSGDLRSVIVGARVLVYPELVRPRSLEFLMPPALRYDAIKTTEAYDRFLDALYMKAKPRPEEIAIPSVQVVAVSGSEPPGHAPYQEAIAALYGIGYGLKMGLKFAKLPRPKGWFDYRVGALETLWWSTTGPLEIDNAKTLRWQAYLMVPGFISQALVDEARKQARAKHPEVPYERASLETIDEGTAVQVLHVGPYSAEQPTIERLLQHAADQGLSVAGRHHEIYISDPRRTKPEKLKTVIRVPTRR